RRPHARPGGDRAARLHRHADRAAPCDGAGAVRHRVQAIHHARPAHPPGRRVFPRNPPVTHDLPFSNPYRHGFARVAVAVPRNRVADPAFNAAETVRLYREAAAQGAAVVAFPELGLSAYTCDDLFHQSTLLDACEAALAQVLEAWRELGCVAIVGLPLRAAPLLFNRAALVAGGRILGVQPKTYLPNYAEFYEARQFAGGDAARSTEIALCGQEGVPFGSRIVFRSRQMPLLALHCEICEDVWVPVPPSSHAALAGAT